ncbi:MAG: PorV/PorQ family protein [Bacteroidetes bacterium]|nr:MAG: PorV/PorQ family protein [Bacteroidota bacterium]
MRKIVIFFCFVASLSLNAMAESPYVGSFARMGYGARGMGMGNAMVAVTTGNISTYYNPALAPFCQERTATASFGILSLDRSLNFLNYTQPIEPNGGFSVGLINAGVSNIDGRDNSGYHTEDYSTFENQFYLAFGFKPEENVALGVAIKMYYSKLFEEVTSSSVGFDLGALVQITPELSIGGSVQDLNSKYQWSTSSVYGTLNGKNTKDNFPIVKKIGAAYTMVNTGVTVSVEYENTASSIQMFRMGAEYLLHENFSVRGGFDRWEINNDNAAGEKPSFGFTARTSFEHWAPALMYAFIFEPFSSHDIHVITLSASF